jgi:hypothetical protein
MVPFESKRRFRVNPIEVAIFAVISLIFVKSSYSLLYARETLEPTVLTAQAEDPLKQEPVKADGRTPASVIPISAPRTFSEVTIGCEPGAISPNVNSTKIRLVGNLCAGKVDGAAHDELIQDVQKISVVNTSAKVTATVFPDYPNRKFSTDYMTLSQGANLIYVQYEFKDGKTMAREFSIMKN